MPGARESFLLFLLAVTLLCVHLASFPRCHPLAPQPPLVLTWSGLTPEQVRTKRAFHELQTGRQVVSFDTDGRIFWQDNWEPSFSCTALARVGRAGDGGKWVCDPLLYLQGVTPPPASGCVVYSFGSNGEFSFEEAVHAMAPGCEIHTVDPAPHTQAPPFLHYHQGSMGARESPGVFTTASLMRHLNHTSVTLLKMDCEGCEFGALTAAALPSERGAIQQILFEVHYSGDAVGTHTLFQTLGMLGFAIFNKEANLGSGGSCVEFSVVHLDRQLDTPLPQ